MSKPITSGRTAGLYIGKSTIFKIFLLGGVAIISAVFIWYTFNVIEKLKDDTRSQVEKYVKLWQMAANSPTSGQELQFIFDEVIVKANFPIVVLNEQHQPIHWRNIKNIAPNDTTRASMEKLKNSEVIEQLQMMPFIEIGIVLAFFIVALIGFHNIRRSEERHIWVGMAKETAHQLGTPISSLMGWTEVIDVECKSDSLGGSGMDFPNDTINNMKVDIERLQRIAKRFGQIGSFPELEPCSLNDVIKSVVDYYCRRLPFEGKGIKINFSPKEVPPVKLNAELFSWALENMVKNSMQSVDSRNGIIDIRTELVKNNKYVTIELSDNGRGIPAGAARKVFRAGFTTKKRGWGLGLTLVKRIIEEYHNGRVILKRSKPGETVFEITLPVASQ